MNVDQSSHSSEPDAGLTVQVRWPSDVAKDAKVVNQALLLAGPPTQAGSDSANYLVFGHIAPPVLADQAALAAFQSAGSVLEPVVCGVFALTTERLRELHQTLGIHLAKLDSATSGEWTAVP